jgi:hypothetical protein
MNSTWTAEVAEQTSITPYPFPTCLLFMMPWYSIGPNKSTATHWKMDPGPTLWSGNGHILCSMHFFSFNRHSVHDIRIVSASGRPLMTHTFFRDLWSVDSVPSWPS